MTGFLRMPTSDANWAGVMLKSRHSSTNSALGICHASEEVTGLIIDVI
jgi:hypothetical protein